MSKIEALLSFSRQTVSFFHPDLVRVYRSQIVGDGAAHHSMEEQIDAAVCWLCAAQDAFPDGGVARSYSLVYNTYLRRQGWIPSYPETTGYIIPTMFDCAGRKGSDELFRRAVRMADWECDVQLENGAVMGGTVDQKNPSPAVFNTGQVIFGWLHAYRETGTQRYLDAAVRAGEFLLSVQDEDGAWRRSLSGFATNALPTYTYNTRTAWALCLLAEVTQDKRFQEAGVRNVEFALVSQAENGWFKNNCLTDLERPLLHTIAYCIRGILETGIILKNEEFVQHARLAADEILARMNPDGMIAGRFYCDWRPAVGWSCLTGNAQISIVWSRLHGVTGESSYQEGASRANGFLRKRQVWAPGVPRLHGGICGSYPIQGDYGRFEILNWATKFYIDSLLEEKDMTG